MTLAAARALCMPDICFPAGVLLQHVRHYLPASMFGTMTGQMFTAVTRAALACAGRPRRSVTSTGGEDVAEQV